MTTIKNQIQKGLVYIFLKAAAKGKTCILNTVFQLIVM